MRETGGNMRASVRDTRTREIDPMAFAIADFIREHPGVITRDIRAAFKIGEIRFRTLVLAVTSERPIYETYRGGHTYWWYLEVNK